MGHGEEAMQLCTASTTHIHARALPTWTHASQRLHLGLALAAAACAAACATTEASWMTAMGAEPAANSACSVQAAGGFRACAKHGCARKDWLGQGRCQRHRHTLYAEEHRSMLLSASLLTHNQHGFTGKASILVQAYGQDAGNCPPLAATRHGAFMGALSAGAIPVRELQGRQPPLPGTLWPETM